MSRYCTENSICVKIFEVFVMYFHASSIQWDMISSKYDLFLHTPGHYIERKYVHKPQPL